MTLDWTPATTGDRLSLGDLVPAALKRPEDRRKRVAARLIARSDALRGWWRVPRDEISSDEKDAKDERDRRERKLATLLGKTVAGLEEISVPDALIELAPFIPSKQGERRDLQFQILAFQAGGSLLNAMDLLFDGIHWASDGAKSARLLRTSEELLHREFSTPVVRRLVDAALPGMRLALDEAGADISELTGYIAICDDNERASVDTLASALDGSVKTNEGARLVDLLAKLVEAGWLRSNGPHQPLHQRDNDGISYLVLKERF
jgi:hypothetical protein